jgi:hypothetical protein
MNLESDKRLNIQLRLDFSSAPTGEARQAGGEDIESLSVTNEPERPADTRRIMEEVCERKNLKEALRQVRSNKGSAGVDGMTVDKLGDYLKRHWPVILEQLLNGIYEPKPVRRVEIPKPDGGGVRKLGIPTVLDRFVQQAVMQVLQRRWNPTFSRHDLIRPLLTSAPRSACLAAFSVAEATRSRSPGVSSVTFRAQSPDLRFASLMDMDFAVSGPLVRRSRLVSGSCPSTRTFALRFLQTSPRGDIRSCP